MLGLVNSNVMKIAMDQRWKRPIGQSKFVGSEVIEKRKGILP